MQLPELEYYSFSQLLAKWCCDKEYLHYLIAHAKIIPAIRLPESMQIPTGVFLGGIPDEIEGFSNSYGHQSYQEYCNATDESDPFWYEKLIPFTSFVYCQNPQSHPTDNRPNNYIFQYFSEIADITKVDRWFYCGDGNIISNREDGERLFVFTKEEISRVESTKEVSEESPNTTNEFSEDSNECTKLNEANHPRPITLSQIVIAFGSFHGYGKKKAYDLKPALQDKPKWSNDAMIFAGTRGRSIESTWNPVELAKAMIKHYEINEAAFTNAFQDKDFLAEWKEQWSSYIERKKELESF